MCQGSRKHFLNKNYQYINKKQTRRKRKPAILGMVDQSYTKGGLFMNTTVVIAVVAVVAVVAIGAVIIKKRKH